MRETNTNQSKLAVILYGGKSFYLGKITDMTFKLVTELDGQSIK